MPRFFVAGVVVAIADGVVVDLAAAAGSCDKHEHDSPNSKHASCQTQKLRLVLRCMGRLAAAGDGAVAAAAPARLHRALAKGFIAKHSPRLCIRKKRVRRKEVWLRCFSSASMVVVFLTMAIVCEFGRIR